MAHARLTVHTPTPVGRVVMPSIGIWAVRLLRKLPHSEAFDEHLSRCAFSVSFFDEDLPLGKVLGWPRLQSGIGEFDTARKAIDAAVLAGHRLQGDQGPVVFEGIDFEPIPKTFH